MPAGHSTPRDVVLVHGAFVDGSGWAGVHRALTKKGFRVSISQHSTASLDDDVATVRRVIAQHEGPVILVGHSYGGAIISEAGNDPKVAALVYVTGFVVDAGESVGLLTKDPVPGAPEPPLLPPADGFLLLDKARFAAAFAQDLPAEEAAFMADAQLPWGLTAVNGQVTTPAWKSKPVWYVVASEDRMIPAVAQRAMAARAGAQVTEVAGSHSLFLSQPDAVAEVIAKAGAAELAAV
jgi:pimeloyl-ACP methyl ester carboxylesterase